MGKFISLAVLITVVFALLLGECATSTPPAATTSAPAASTTQAPAATTAPAKTTVTPKYGGTLKYAESLFPSNNLGWVGDQKWLTGPATQCIFLIPSSRFALVGTLTDTLDEAEIEKIACSLSVK